MTEEKELKVKLPADMHEKLHLLKMARGVYIKDVVAEALDRHFEDIKENGLR